MIALTFPHFNPLTKKSPLLRVPAVIITFAIGPLPTSILDSKTIPFASVSNLFLNLKVQLEELHFQLIYLNFV